MAPFQNSMSIFNKIDEGEIINRICRKGKIIICQLRYLLPVAVFFKKMQSFYTVFGTYLSYFSVSVKYIIAELPLSTYNDKSLESLHPICQSRSSKGMHLGCSEQSDFQRTHIVNACLKHVFLLIKGWE